MVFINCGIYDFPLSCFGDRREGQGLSVRTYSFILSCVQGGVEGAARWGGGECRMGWGGGGGW